MGNHFRGVLLACVGIALGCGAATPPPRTPARRADEVATRDPDSLGRPPSSRTELGSLTTVAPSARELPAPRPPVDGTVALMPLIDVADDAETTPYPTRDGALTLPGGLTLRGLPRSTTVRALRERGSGDEVWEIVDARGRRQALVKARSWTRAIASDDALGDNAPIRAAKLRARWRGAPVDVRVDRFQHDARIYTIERRAQGTDWIWSGLSFSP